MNVVELKTLSTVSFLKIVHDIICLEKYREVFISCSFNAALAYGFFMIWFCFVVLHKGTYWCTNSLQCTFQITFYLKLHSWWIFPSEIWVKFIMSIWFALTTNYFNPSTFSFFLFVVLFFLFFLFLWNNLPLKQLKAWGTFGFPSRKYSL